MDWCSMQTPHFKAPCTACSRRSAACSRRANSTKTRRSLPPLASASGSSRSRCTTTSKNGTRTPIDHGKYLSKNERRRRHRYGRDSRSRYATRPGDRRFRGGGETRRGSTPALIDRRAHGQPDRVVRLSRLQHLLHLFCFVVLSARKPHGAADEHGRDRCGGVCCPTAWKLVDRTLRGPPGPQAGSNVVGCRDVLRVADCRCSPGLSNHRRIRPGAAHCSTTSARAKHGR